MTLQLLLPLADGSRLALCATDPDACKVLAVVSEASGLGVWETPLPEEVPRLGVVGNDHPQWSAPGRDGNDALVALEERGAMRPRLRREAACPYVSEPLSDEEWWRSQLARISAAVGATTHQRGGVLLHGALAMLAPDGPPSARPAVNLDFGHVLGVVLAGRSGVGKTTACGRLPHPWRTLADDMTLVVRDAGGHYWAHPWPTWSSLFGEKRGMSGHTWDVRQAVPLSALFFLSQGPRDQARPVGAGESACRLVELARQASRSLERSMAPPDLCDLNRVRFGNLCSIAKTIPAYWLDVSLTGPFWEEMARVLGTADGQG